MNARRRLSLTSEALTDLTTEELNGVAGARALPTTPVPECFDNSDVVCTFNCWTRGTTCAC